MYYAITTALKLKIRDRGDGPGTFFITLSAKPLQTFCCAGSRWKKWLFLEAYIYTKWKIARNLVPQFCPPTPHSPPGLYDPLREAAKIWIFSKNHYDFQTQHPKNCRKRQGPVSTAKKVSVGPPSIWSWINDYVYQMLLQETMFSRVLSFF